MPGRTPADRAGRFTGARAAATPSRSRAAAPATIPDRNRVFRVREVYASSDTLRKRRKWRLADLQQPPEAEQPLLWGAQLPHVRWPGARLANVSLWEFDLSRADLRRIQLSHVGLRWARLRSANLSAAQLGHAPIYDSDLRGAVLRGATLSDAELFSCDLRGADLTKADLTGAQLFRVDLRGARLTGAVLRGVTYGAQTRWPAGFDAQKEGATEAEQPR